MIVEYRTENLCDLQFTVRHLSGLIDQLRHNIWAVSPEKAFENLDEDKDGVISPAEFKKGLERLGLSGLSLGQVKG